MSLFALIVLALALAMDATAVAAAKGLGSVTVPHTAALRVGLLFGGFQAAMTAVGAFAGSRFASFIAAYDHWIAFVLLVGIGGKMIGEAFAHADGAEATEARSQSDRFAWKGLLVLAVATSIDALAAGVTLPLTDANVPLAVGLIGVTAGVLSFAGVHVGRKLGHHLGKKLDIAGGVVLVLLGAKTLLEHLLAPHG